jgi:hypothetical protein
MKWKDTSERKKKLWVYWNIETLSFSVLMPRSKSFRRWIVTIRLCSLSCSSKKVQTSLTWRQPPLLRETKWALLLWSQQSTLESNCQQSLKDLILRWKVEVIIVVVAKLWHCQALVQVDPHRSRLRLYNHNRSKAGHNHLWLQMSYSGNGQRLAIMTP